MATRTATARSFDDVRLLLRAAMLYYVEDLTQAEVARRLGVSRPTAGRLVARARDRGIVRIEVVLPEGVETPVFAEFEGDLEAAYGLREAIVVPNAPDNEDATLSRLGVAAADLLTRRLNAGDRLGLAWGATMAAMTDALPSGAAECAEVVQLDGSTSSLTYRTRGEYIINHCADQLGATPYPLSAPLFADPATVRSLHKDSLISQTIDRGRACDIVMFSVGDLTTASTLLRGSFIDPDVHAALVAAGAVGDACGRYFDIDGKATKTDLAKSTVAVELEQLRECPCTIVVAGGARKQHAILGALRGGLADVLVTDDVVAAWLLDRNATEEGAP
ncbi:MAG TPA: sugar-binding domain-containing protein [Nocardioidaceae bacterium]|nr:sugar-binding domain-containing protein [Nocardioidaceae bacterium]